MDISEASVVVGVKDLDTDLATVRLAAREAAWTRTQLHVVHAFAWPMFGLPDDDREQDENAVESAADDARALFTKLPVTPEVIDGKPVTVLLRAASGAALLVLGGAGLARPWGDPSESVSVQVAARAAAPVLFACGDDRPGPVVAGVDGSADGAAALHVAVAEAARRGTGLVVPHADGGSCVPVCVTPSGEHRGTRAAPDAALIEESHAAQLIVVGAQGERPTLLGPVTQAVLRHASCPVLVARADPVRSRAHQALAR